MLPGGNFCFGTYGWRAGTLLYRGWQRRRTSQSCTRCVVLLVLPDPAKEQAYRHMAIHMRVYTFVSPVPHAAPKGDVLSIADDGFSEWIKDPANLKRWEASLA